MDIHIDKACRQSCWNFRDTTFELCVGCNCCSKDKKTRYESRIRCLEKWIKEDETFDSWIEGYEKVQQANIKSNLCYYKEELRYYRKRLAALQEDKCD